MVSNAIKYQGDRSVENSKVHKIIFFWLQMLDYHRRTHRHKATIPVVE